MKIKIKFFGQLAEVTGMSYMEIPEISNTDSLIKKIVDDFPELKKFKYRISVNQKLIQGNEELNPGSEVAFLPPFAGG